MSQITSDSLDRYHAPHDPEAIHQLHWNPGIFGKGLLTHDGVLHTWNTTDFEDGNPYHRQYRQDHGIPDNSYTSFWIDKNGRVTSIPNQDVDWASVSDLDPRLDFRGVDPDQWRFAGFPNQNRAIEGPPKIVDDQPGEWGWQGDESGWSARRPFIYHAPTNTIYIGDAGKHHQDIYDKYDTNDDFWKNGETYEGYAMKGLEGHPDEVSFYRRGPKNPEPILKALSEHLGVPVADPLGDSLWKFAWTEEEQELRKSDPLAFEKRVDWDRPGDVSRHPDVEWVPTSELKQFIEYDRRPGSVHQYAPERYKALAEHIQEHGFKNPVQLEYNQDTGMAHMGEGNHRTWIALEYGIPAMPVRVNRSRRESPTQIPVSLRPQPEWESRFDPSGYHIPASMRPSHIGLETVPPPNQRTASGPNVLNWRPGIEGKGLVAPDGGVHTWNAPGGIFPAHFEYKEDNPHLGVGPEEGQTREFWIRPNGDVSFWKGVDGTDYEDMEAVRQADPRLNVTELSNDDVRDDWVFSKVA